MKAPGGDYYSDLINMSGKLFLIGAEGQLWTTDGTVAGTSTLPGLIGTNDLTAINGEIFFSATDGTDGTQLWKTDGMAAGTVMLSDVNPTSGGLKPGNLTAVNGDLFFTANDGTDGEQLWEYVVATGSVVMLTDQNASGGGIHPGNLSNANGTLFFSANDGIHGQELWKSDGTAAGTSMVDDINQVEVGYGPFLGNPRTGPSLPPNLTAFNGSVLFTASDGTHGVQLWETDGTADETVMLTDVNPGGGGLNPGSTD